MLIRAHEHAMYWLLCHLVQNGSLKTCQVSLVTCLPTPLIKVKKAQNVFILGKQFPVGTFKILLKNFISRIYETKNHPVTTYEINNIASIAEKNFMFGTKEGNQFWSHN